jgi:hypothetical protein
MKQLSLTFEPGIGSRNRSLREHLATRVDSVGLVAVAGKIDVAPSKLTEKLAGSDSGGKSRGLTVDELETYIQRTGDVSPIHYLVDKYLQDPAIVQQEAAAKFAELMEQLIPLAHAAGFVAGTVKKARP